MRTAPLIRAVWISACLFAFATVSLAQPALSPDPGPTAAPTPLRIGYAGKLLGYFRVPSEQERDTSTGCPARPKELGSDEAKEFFKASGRYENAVLVGTGDNFSPQLESRAFMAKGPAAEYTPRNKELYSWGVPKDGKTEQWVFIGEESDEMKRLLAQGEGRIPRDNVGCFLAAAGFSAVVPGKHDFYYGTERLRQLARFMAGVSGDGYKPVQMLGSNIVVRTTRLDGDTAPATTEDWPKNLSAQNLKTVYPWFSAPIRLKLTPPKDERLRAELKLRHKELSDRAKFEAFLLAWELPPSADEDAKAEWKKFLDSAGALKSIRICLAGDFNEVPAKICQEKGYVLEPASEPAAAVSVSEDGSSVTYSFPVTKEKRAETGGKAGHYSTFEPGRNYGLCLKPEPPADGKPAGEAGDVEKRCTVFSVHAPFFSYPHRVPMSGDGKRGPDPDPFRGPDPDPFFFRPDALPEHEVAIFGVVDPTLAEQVGVLNFSWQNNDEKLKSVVAIEEPVEAVKQQLAYFERWYEERQQGRTARPFTGLKVLLAQMSPQRARLLATHLPQFQVVVAGASQEQATDETEQSVVWRAEPKRAAFIAVPPPAYDTKEAKVVISLGLVNASKEGADWRLSADRASSPARTVINLEDKRAKAEEAKQAEKLKLRQAEQDERVEKWDSKKKQPDEDQLAFHVRSRLKGCLSHPPALQSPPFAEQMRLLTLCAMRERFGADIALLQKRDFFFNKVPVTADDVGEFQSILDHVVWKGDLLTLMLVPGSAIKKAMEQSKKYEDEDANPLSLVNEKSRGLVVLGVEKRGKDYIVNELPLDDKKMYAVATTDYIGAGDTGYPDLDAAALIQRRHPAQFPSGMETVSSVVCRELFASDAEQKANCLAELKRDNYLDRLQAEAGPTKRPAGLGERLKGLSPFKWPAESKEPETLGEAAEQGVQQRSIWTYSLQNLSFGFNRVSNNLTDAEVAEKFAGVPSSGISSTQFQQSASVVLAARVSRVSHRNEFFLSGGFDFKETTTGDGQAKPQAVVQVNNRMTGELGYIRSLRGGRSRDRVGINVSLKLQAPLQQPFTTFALGSGDPLKVYQGRSVQILPRLGLRWQNGANSFEVGAQAGRELNSLIGYRFGTQGGVVECPANAAESFKKCVERLSKKELANPITKDSVTAALLANRPRAGVYLKAALAVPFHEKVKYELTNEGDFFLANFRGDNATDTRFLNVMNHKLKFSVWPSLSFGPTLQMLHYKNKVNGDLLSQKTFGIETSFSFDIFNRRERKAQLRTKPTAAGQ